MPDSIDFSCFFLYHVSMRWIRASASDLQEGPCTKIAKMMYTLEQGYCIDCREARAGCIAYKHT